MKKPLLVLMLLCALPAWAAAQVPPGPPGPPDMARRQALQGQIIRQFMDRVSMQLGLDQPTRQRLAQHLRESGEARRELARSTAQLRGQMMRAVRDSATSDAEFKRLLKQMTELRQKEEDLWRQDQDALSRILTPRQHTHFVFMWLRFNEQIREMALQRPPMRPR